MKHVTIYILRGCPFCVRAKHLLERKGQGYEEIDVTFEPDKRQEVSRRTGHPTFPQIFIGDEFVGGFDEIAAFERAGRLDHMLR